MNGNCDYDQKSPYSHRFVVICSYIIDLNKENGKKLNFFYFKIIENLNLSWVYITKKKQQIYQTRDLPQFSLINLQVKKLKKKSTKNFEISIL